MTGRRFPADMDGWLEYRDELLADAERLREELNILTDVGQQQDAEILRLREALERLRSGPDTLTQKGLEIVNAALDGLSEGEKGRVVSGGEAPHASPSPLVESDPERDDDIPFEGPVDQIVRAQGSVLPDPERGEQAEIDPIVEAGLRLANERSKPNPEPGERCPTCGGQNQPLVVSTRACDNPWHAGRDWHPERGERCPTCLSDDPAYDRRGEIRSEPCTDPWHDPEREGMADWLGDDGLRMGTESDTPTRTQTERPDPERGEGLPGRCPRCGGKRDAPYNVKLDDEWVPCPNNYHGPLQAVPADPERDENG